MSRATVSFDGGLRDLARRAAAVVLPAVAEPSAEGAQVILGNARGQWPVKSGASRAGLFLQRRQAQATIELEISDPVWYTARVHGGASWSVLVAAPMMELAREMAATGGSRIVAALRRR